MIIHEPIIHELREYGPRCARAANACRAVNTRVKVGVGKVKRGCAYKRRPFFALQRVGVPGYLRWQAW